MSQTNSFWRLVWLVSLAGLVGRSTGCGSREKTGLDETPRLTAEEKRAIQLAENYIALNGFTEIRPAARPDDRRLQILFEVRRNTLRSRAYGLAREATTGRWLVIFQFSDRAMADPVTKAQAGQAVVVDLETGDVLMADKDFLLRAVGKKLTPGPAAAATP
jgi:hypothetical protein